MTIDVSNPPPDTVSSLSFHPTSNFLCATSWANDIRLWEVNSNGQTNPMMNSQSTAPILHASFVPDGNRILFCGCNGTGNIWDLGSNGTVTQCAQHDGPIRNIFWAKPHNLVVTGGWDKTLKYWDTRQANPVHTCNLGVKVFCMDVKDNMLVVGGSNRTIVLYDLNQPDKQMMSTQTNKEWAMLKWQIRCIKIFNDVGGFAAGSIEGRTAVIDVRNTQGTFSFKCHRTNSEILPVNDISFSALNTFSTAGGDGNVYMWDKVNKSRLKVINTGNNPVTATAFNFNSTIFAYSLGYDWSKGAQFYDKSLGSKIVLYSVNQSDIQPKPYKGKKN